MEQFFERAFIFAVLTVLVSIIRYGTYFISIFKRETRPHLFSWVNWGLIISIGAYAQLKLGGDFFSLYAVICGAYVLVCGLFGAVLWRKGYKKVGLGGFFGGIGANSCVGCYKRPGFDAYFDYLY